VEILVKLNQISPVRVVLKLARAAIHWPPPTLIA
jgi:hypothetical protein